MTWEVSDTVNYRSQCLTPLELVAVEQIPCIYFFYDIIQTALVSVGDDGVTLLFEFF